MIIFKKNLKKTKKNLKKLKNEGAIFGCSPLSVKNTSAFVVTLHWVWFVRSTVTTTAYIFNIPSMPENIFYTDFL